MSVLRAIHTRMHPLGRVAAMLAGPLLALGLVVGGGAAPALASTAASAPATTTYFSAPTAHAAVQPAASCSWSINGVALGTIICPSTGLLVEFANGTYEDFEVGTSHAVWTAWGSGTSWAEKSLGGAAYYDSAGSGNPTVWLVARSADGWGMTIGTTNASGQHRCLNRTDSASGSWGSWFNC